MDAHQAKKICKMGCTISASCYSDGSYAIKKEQNETFDEFEKRVKDKFRLELQFFKELPNGERIWLEGEPYYFAS